jgi:hypothetical protein
VVELDWLEAERILVPGRVASEHSRHRNGFATRRDQGNCVTLPDLWRRLQGKMDDSTPQRCVN